MTSFYIAHSAVVLTDYENIDPKCNVNKFFVSDAYFDPSIRFERLLFLKILHEETRI